MTGVEILAVEKIAIAFSYNIWIPLGIFITSVFVAGIVWYILSDRYRDIYDFFAGCLLGLLVGVILGLVSFAATATPTEYENQYKVIISDEVSMNEFYENYEVIDQEGKIFTVREKEIND